MPIERLYTGDDGETHIEELHLADHPKLSEGQLATSIFFRVFEQGHYVDWHHAPRRQYVITISGEVEIGLGDGSLYRFGPGSVILAEDLTGRGHTTRTVGDRARVSATIPLADG